MKYLEENPIIYLDIYPRNSGVLQELSPTLAVQFERIRQLQRKEQDFVIRFLD
jgi:hypothetical protein